MQGGDSYLSRFLLLGRLYVGTSWCDGVADGCGVLLFRGLPFCLFLLAFSFLVFVLCSKFEKVSVFLTDREGNKKFDSLSLYKLLELHKLIPGKQLKLLRLFN